MRLPLQWVQSLLSLEHPRAYQQPQPYRNLGAFNRAPILFKEAQMTIIQIFLGAFHPRIYLRREKRFIRFRYLVCPLSLQVKI